MYASVPAFGHSVYTISNMNNFGCRNGRVTILLDHVGDAELGGYLYHNSATPNLPAAIQAHQELTYSSMISIENIGVSNVGQYSTKLTCTWVGPFAFLNTFQQYQDASYWSVTH